MVTVIVLLDGSTIELVSRNMVILILMRLSSLDEDLFGAFLLAHPIIHGLEQGRYLPLREWEIARLECVLRVSTSVSSLIIVHLESAGCSVAGVGEPQVFLPHINHPSRPSRPQTQILRRSLQTSFGAIR